MERQYTNGFWFYDVGVRGFYYRPAGYYETDMPVDYGKLKFLSFQEVVSLVPVLEQEGFIKPRLDERLRSEDLKITHRLLDLLEKKLPV